LFEIFEGHISNNKFLGEVDFDSIPRTGEKVIYAFQDVSLVYEVVEIIHAFLPDRANENIYVRRLGTEEEYFS
ncbi:MAG: hypothetical protein RIA63_04410, partial [Cyclobacteriaceae bacterium]